MSTSACVLTISFPLDAVRQTDGSSLVPFNAQTTGTPPVIALDTPTGKGCYSWPEAQLLLSLEWHAYALNSQLLLLRPTPQHEVIAWWTLIHLWLSYTSRLSADMSAVNILPSCSVLPCKRIHQILFSEWPGIILTLFRRLLLQSHVGPLLLFGEALFFPRSPTFCLTLADFHCNFVLLPLLPPQFKLPFY